VQRVQAEAGFGEGFFEFGLVSLQVFDFRLVDRWVDEGEDIEE
jgi:hypothetical protein